MNVLIEIEAATKSVDIHLKGIPKKHVERSVMRRKSLQS